jgi:uncharacterized membrane protein YeaQ/YmgE (transglycosylase-associated protein family)
MLIGSTVGGFVPTLWGAELLSFSAILGNLIGGFLGIWIGYKIGQRY